jgi:NAD(P)H-flavin reductase
VLDASALRESWNQVAAHGDEVPRHFYALLFLMFPETRELFPVSMAAQRDRLVGALGRTVSNAGNLDDVVPFLQQLGRDHRKFAVATGHYPAVGTALLATLEHFLGPRWTDDLAEQWTSAFELIAQVMIEADEAARDEPPWWDADVIAHERRTFDIAVLTLRPMPWYPYRPGQSVAVETHLRPKLWRYYSPANAPRRDGTFDLHVRAVPGGAVSGALVHGVRVGDVLRLGAPVGDELTLDRIGGGDLLLLAGGTGLAPLKALAEQVVAAGNQRRVALFTGVRTSREQYDLKALGELQSRSPRVTVVAVLSDDPLHSGEQATAAEAALRQGQWPDHDIVVCGSDEMVSGTFDRLRAAGVDPGRIHTERFTGDRYSMALPAGEDRR